jgi:hypothetical protein
MLRRFLKISVALGAIGSLALAALLAFLWCEHTRPLVLPVPTGHFAVGRATYTWVNDAVSELLSPSDAEKETIVAWMWLCLAKIETEVYRRIKWLRHRYVPAELDHSHSSSTKHQIDQQLPLIAVPA